MDTRTRARAALVVGVGKPLTVEDVDFPELERNAMMTEVLSATLCGTDIHFWQGRAENAMPYIPGHETCARVVSIEGERFDVTGEPVRVGDRIIFAYPFCGQCYHCVVANEPTACANALRFGRERVTNFPYLDGGCATHQYVPPLSAVIKVPDSVSNDLAAAASCALRTVMHGFERLGRVASHEVAVIQGSGPVGLFATAVAVDHGFRRVLVVGAPSARLEVATAFGADATLNIEEATSVNDRINWVLSETHGHGADVAIQCVSTAAISEGLEYLRTGGRYLSIGGGGGTIEVSGAALSGKMLTITGVSAASGRHFYQALQFLDGGRFPFQRLISGHYTLENLTEAFESMRSFAEVKAAVAFD